MTKLDLSFDEVLSTTRAVRKRLDLGRPVEPDVLRECFELAVQAPTPGGSQGWQFIVVTDAAQRLALAELYRRAVADTIAGVEEGRQQAAALGPEKVATFERMMASSRYLTEHMQDVPVLVVPCLQGRVEAMPWLQQVASWGGIFPAVWSFMLAARSRGLGTALTGIHLIYEREAAAILGIPYEQVTQAGLVPVAYTLGTTFKPANRNTVETVLHWDRW